MGDVTSDIIPGCLFFNRDAVNDVAEARMASCMYFLNTQTWLHRDVSESSSSKGIVNVNK